MLYQTAITMVTHRLVEMDKSSQTPCRLCCVPPYPMLDAPRRFGRPAPIPGRFPTGLRANIWKPTWLLRLRPFRPAAVWPIAMPPRCMRMPMRTMCLTRWCPQMENLGRMIDGSADFRRLLESPLIDVNTATAAAQAVLAQEGFGKEVRDFVGVISVNRRLRVLRDIVSAFAASGGGTAGHRDGACGVRASAERRAAPAASRSADRGRVRQRQH